jgi:hypothetical protein
MMQLPDSSSRLLHNESMRFKQPLKILSAIGAVCLWCAGLGYGSTATNLTGLYFTGMNSAGGLATTTDAHWSVTYASTNGGTSANTAYEGAAYVIPSANIPSTYIQNSSNSQWITAPGATGGYNLPGNGNTGSDEGIYVYTLAFQITGTGRRTVTNAVSISLTIAADDQYSVYVNPSGNGTTLPTGTAAGSGTSAWTNTTLGTNYLVIVVDNTNSITGSSTSTAVNPSGLLVYQTGQAITVGGKNIPIIPEVGTWLPVAATLGLFGWRFWRRAGLALARRSPKPLSDRGQTESGVMASRLQNTAFTTRAFLVILGVKHPGPRSSVAERGLDKIGFARRKGGLEILS